MAATCSDPRCNLKALSLWQPWASLIVWDLKRIETRSWWTSHRGPLFIHAANRWEGDAARLCRLSRPFNWAMDRMGYARDEHDGRPPEMPFGAILGRVDVLDCIPTSAVEIIPESTELGYRLHDGQTVITSAEAAYGDFGPERYAWLLANPVRFDTPIRWSGRQQLFDVAVDGAGMPDPNGPPSRKTLPRVQLEAASLFHDPLPREDRR